MRKQILAHLPPVLLALLEQLLGAEKAEAILHNDDEHLKIKAKG